MKARPAISRAWGFGAWLAMLCLAACAAQRPHSELPPEPLTAGGVEPRREVATATEAEDELEVRGMLGTLDPDQIDSALARALPEALECFAQRLAEEPYLSGEMSIYFRIGADGGIRRLFARASSLGSWPVELCVLDRLAQARFPAPSGGNEAEFTLPLRFPAQMHLEEWDGARVRQTVRAVRRQSGLPPRLAITLYVDAQGQVASVGMAGEQRVDTETARQVAEIWQTVAFEAPQGPYSKVTFTW